MKEVEYRVRPVTRYVVTRFFSESGPEVRGSGCETCGEFDNEKQALRAMEALASHEDRPEASLPMMADGQSIKWTE